MAEFPAMTHVALTVTDLDASIQWYERLLGIKPVLDEDAGGFHHTVYLLQGGTLLGLHKHPATDGNDRFDEHRPGLDHLSFGVADRAELEAWQARLEELGIPHGGIVDAHYGSGSPSATPTTSPWSSSRRPGRPVRRPPTRRRRSSQGSSVHGRL
jgi:catechol 2,3-dioxygenase-like lactoylglutathione lyase family enzyme